MCGIAGEFRFDNTAPDAAAIERMLAKLARRGPDAEGQHTEGPVRLGHRRLAIIDLSPRSRQPMVDAATGTALVFNGTIYNYPDLRTELIDLGHLFHSDGDTEVILRAYLQWGEACVERLHGMFAFAIWDREATVPGARPARHQAAVLRAEPAQRFRFASTPQALLAAGGVDTGIDRGGAASPVHAARGDARAAHDPARASASSHPAPPDGEPTAAQLATGNTGHCMRSARRSRRASRVDRCDPRIAQAGGQKTHRDCRRQSRRAAVRRARIPACWWRCWPSKACPT